jgi:hypothetical protein
MYRIAQTRNNGFEQNAELDSSGGGQGLDAANAYLARTLLFNSVPNLERDICGLCGRANKLIVIPRLVRSTTMGLDGLASHNPLEALSLQRDEILHDDSEF